MANIIGPEDYLDGNQNAPTIGEVQELQLKQRSENYARRERTSYTPESGDAELYALQAQLNAEANPLIREQLEAKVNALATQLVGGEAPSEPKPTTVSSKDIVFNEFGKEAYENTMQWAGETMSDEVIDSFNGVLQSNTDDAVVAFQGLQELSTLPEGSYTSEGTAQGFGADLADRLSEQYGEAGDQLVTLNAALVAGHAKPADVIKMAMSDPKLRNAALSAARQGLITLHL